MMISGFPTRHRKPARMVLALLLAACGTEPLAEFRGTYVLERVNDVPVPAVYSYFRNSEGVVDSSSYIRVDSSTIEVLSPSTVELHRYFTTVHGNTSSPGDSSVLPWSYAYGGARYVIQGNEIELSAPSLSENGFRERGIVGGGRLEIRHPVNGKPDIVLLYKRR